MILGAVNALRFVLALSAGQQRFVAITFLFQAMAFFTSSGWAEKPVYRVDWSQSQLSVSANQAPLDKVLAEVIARTGLKVRGLPAFSEVVSVEFKRLPLREGLQKLLTGKSYFILDKKSAKGVTEPGLILFLNSPPNNALLPTDPNTAPVVASENGNAEVLEFFTQQEAGVGGVEFDGSQTLESLSQPAVEAESSGSEIPESLPQPGAVTESSGSEAPDRLSQLEQAISANAPDLQDLQDKLYAATQDDEPLIRELAYRELFQRNDATVVDLLRRDARSENSDVRRIALDLLSQFTGENAVDVLTEAASDSNTDIRQMAMENLAKNAQGVAIIKEKLRDPNPEVRMTALESLASLGNGSAAEAAVAALHDSDEQVRSRAEAIRQELPAMPAVE